MKHFQVAVIGSGFAGSITAMIAHRLGFATVLIERGRHPRFAIGESSTPLANLFLEEIATEYDLSCLQPLSKWGTWQRQLPGLACGLKRGFTFYAHEWGKGFTTDTDRRRQLLVGASPNESIADTHWYRPDFDAYLAAEAGKLGLTYWDETSLGGMSEEPDGMHLRLHRQGETTDLTAEFVIDATGSRGFLFRQLGLAEVPFESYPPTQALFSHFCNVGPLPQSFAIDGAAPPYPSEQAAVHHVFPGGWIWVLKFNNGITSAGVAATDALANELGFSTGSSAWQRLLERLPSLAEIFEPARAVVPFVHLPRLAFCCGTITGSRWAMLPSAAGFVDPLLSTGFPLTLSGVMRLGRLLRSHWGKPSFRSEVEQYSQLTLRELKAAATLVGALYATMDRFDLFKELSLLYFTAASYSETARRLGKIPLADSFLLCRHPDFARQLPVICEAARRARSAEEVMSVKRQIRELIEPFNVAGLTDESRKGWYPACASDLLKNASKLGVSPSEIKAMLRKCGLETVQ